MAVTLELAMLAAAADLIPRDGIVVAVIIAPSVITTGKPRG